MTLPDALELRRRLAALPYERQSKSLRHLPHEYVVKRHAQRYLGCSPFYVTIRRARRKR